LPVQSDRSYPITGHLSVCHIPCSRDSTNKSSTSKEPPPFVFSPPTKYKETLMDVRDIHNVLPADPLAQSIAPSQAQQQAITALKDVAFGSIAGMAGKCVEYPFDTVKVRLQSQPDNMPLRYTGPIDCFRQSLRRDGVLGLYRGISAPMFGAAVETSSLFFSYQVAQDALQSTLYKGVDPLPLHVLVGCGAFSGAFASLLLTPIELIKCKMQVPVETSPGIFARPRPLDLIASVYRHHGFGGFWHGQMGTLIREMGGSASWFGAYESVTLAFRNIQKDGKIGSDESLPIYQQMIAGAAAGMSYNFLFYPADTIKSRMQTETVGALLPGQKQNTFWAVGRVLWRQHGIKGMYRGCGITVARSAPSSAIIFAIYEYLKKSFF
jgi:ornithine carrier protein